MKKLVFLSSFVIIGLFSSSIYADQASRAVDTTSASPAQISSEIAKKHADSKKYLLNEAGQSDTQKQPPQVINDAEAQAAASAPPSAPQAVPNANGQVKSPAQPQTPAPTSISNGAGNSQNQNPGYVQPSDDSEPTPAASSNSNSKTKDNWNLGY